MATLGLTPIEIAVQIGVKRSTVQRWMAAGKLTDTRRGRQAKRQRTRLNGARPKNAPVTPSEWAAAVRREYALSATDEELVRLAEAALRTAQNGNVSASVQLSASGRFQAIVKQLALASARDVEQPKEKPTADARVITRAAVAGDPRRLLMAVK